MSKVPLDFEVDQNCLTQKQHWKSSKVHLHEKQVILPEARVFCAHMQFTGGA